MQQTTKMCEELGCLKVAEFECIIKDDEDDTFYSYYCEEHIDHEGQVTEL